MCRDLGDVGMISLSLGLVSIRIVVMRSIATSAFTNDGDLELT
jgi:hypothetical protein